MMGHSTRRSSARGFTLIELMVSVAIIGLLASVALPEYARNSLRAKSAERRTILVALEQALADTITNDQGLPGGVASWSGAWNPPPPLSTTKRPFDWSMVAWNQLPFVVAGNSYYSYYFAALDPGKNGQNVTITVGAEGDLDGDGVASIKEMYYLGLGYSFEPDMTAIGWDGVTKGPEDPPQGLEDLTTF
jgi:prepilin-type N-terminal cleavage/methylation domain-containing protein